MTLRFTDTATLSGTARRAQDNALLAEAFAVRTGIQVYSGAEVGLVDRATVRVYRPESEVRKPESLLTFSHAPITLGHPDVPVTDANWKDLAKGEVSTEATWDGNKIKLPLIVKDADAISAIEGGTRELSAGYTCDLDFVEGNANGEQYDAIQRNIKINHLAIVPKGRAGSGCRIGDQNTGTDWATWGASPIPQADKEFRQMADTLHTVVLGDQAVQASAADTSKNRNLQSGPSKGAVRHGGKEQRRDGRKGQGSCQKGRRD